MKEKTNDPRRNLAPRLTFQQIEFLNTAMRQPIGRIVGSTVALGLLSTACYVLSLASAPYRSAAYGAEGNTKPAPTVKAEDLHSGRAQIIGYLGRPLGEIVTVRGVWRNSEIRGKGTGPVYRVTHVDGKPVAPPVDLPLERVAAVVQAGRSGQSDKEAWDWKAHWGGTVKPPEFNPGQEWEFAGVETCSMHVSSGDWDERGPIIAESMHRGRYGFVTTFEFIRARRINTVQGTTQQ